ncbi:MAG: DUF6216 family protein [Herminiimonas sp.]|uniref:DUF6216 family protein n=1 Tax=Herminiimonas sp. TaxID=1926289 RepID=UPI00271AE2B8|nr:DUF6216 family protein [Herminiimonas sp.]MDO9419235.1 DUF6216 family protein [Herminiimonas sp.]
MLEGIRGGLNLLGSFGVALPVFAIIAMGIVGFMIWKRTRSMHPLMARIWRVFHGNKDCKDTTVGAFLDEQAALMEFRFITGVNVRTRKQAHAVIDWTRKNNEDIGDVAACGFYFDLERPALKEKEHLPRKGILFLGLICATFSFSATVLFTFGITVDRALLQMKESGTYFFLSEEYAKPLFSKQGVSTSQCKDRSSLLEGSFSPNDAQTICKLLGEEKLATYIKTTVKEQRIAFGFVALIFAWFFREILGWFRHGTNAQSMNLRLTSVAGSLQLNLCDEEQRISS